MFKKLKLIIPLFIIIMILIGFILFAVKSCEYQQAYETSLVETSCEIREYTVILSEHHSKATRAWIYYSDGEYSNQIMGLPREYEDMYPSGSTISIQIIWFYSPITKNKIMRLYIQNLSDGQYYFYYGASGIQAILSE